MNRCRSILKLLAAALLLPGTASAQTAKLVKIPWLVVEVGSDVETVSLRKGEAIPFARLVPAAPLRLNQDVVIGGKIFLPKGTTMARSVLSGHIYCEITRRPRFEFFKCLEDTNGDDRLDNYSSVFAREYYYGVNVEREYLMASLAPWNHHQIDDPLPLSILDAAADAHGVQLQMKLADNREKRVNIDFCGAPIGGVSEFCMTSHRVNPAEFGISRDVIGGTFTVVARDAATVTLSIRRPRGATSLN